MTNSGEVGGATLTPRHTNAHWQRHTLGAAPPAQLQTNNWTPETHKGPPHPHTQYTHPGDTTTHSPALCAHTEIHRQPRDKHRHTHPHTRLTHTDMYTRPHNQTRDKVTKSHKPDTHPDPLTYRHLQLHSDTSEADVWGHTLN